MKKHELVSSLVWAVVGVLFLRGAIVLGPGKLGDPGPGFFPFLMAVSLILFSIIHVIFSMRKGGQSHSASYELFWPRAEGIKRVLLTIISLLGFVFALNYLGFALTAFLFMVAMLRFVEKKKWRGVFLIGGLTAVLSYMIFQFTLRSHLPVGPLGF